MSDIEERRKMLSAIREDVSRRQLSDAQNFDRAILTLSSAGLGVSLAIVTQHESIKAPCLLWLSWIGFIGAIGVTLLSFLVSKRGAANRSLEIAIEAFVHDKPEALKERNVPSEQVDMMANVSGAFFFAAIVFTVLFVASNIGGSNVSDDKVTKVVGIQRPTQKPMTADKTGEPIKKGAGGTPFVPIIPDAGPAASPAAPAADPAPKTDAAPSSRIQAVKPHVVSPTQAVSPKTAVTPAKTVEKR